MKWLERFWTSVQVVSSLSSSSSLLATEVQSQQQQQRRIQNRDATNKPPNFLLIGNSYTNNLGPTLQSILVDANIPEWSNPDTNTSTVQVQANHPPGFTFPRHLGSLLEGASLQGQLSPELPAESAWQFVVMQDQSQVPAFVEWDSIGGEFFNSVQAAKELNQYIADSAGKSGAQTMFFLTWGRRDLDSNNPEVFPNFTVMQDKLTEGYMRYVEETSTPERPTYVAPVGLVFQTIHEDLVQQGLVPNGGETLFTALYSGDGSHPSALGTYAAALTIYSSMTGWNPNDIDWFADGVNVTQGKAVQEAVARTLATTYESNFILYPWDTTPDWVLSCISSSICNSSSTTSLLVDESTTMATTNATPATMMPSPLFNSTEAPSTTTNITSSDNNSNTTEAPSATANTTSIDGTNSNSTEAASTNITGSTNTSWTTFTLPNSTSILRGPLTEQNQTTPSATLPPAPPSSTSVPVSTDDSITTDSTTDESVGTSTEGSSFEGVEEGLEGPSLTNVLSAGTRIHSSYGPAALLLAESFVLVLASFL